MVHLGCAEQPLEQRQPAPDRRRARIGVRSGGYLVLDHRPQHRVGETNSRADYGYAVFGHGCWRHRAAVYGHGHNTANTGVTWSVNGVPGGSAATGVIDATGRYVAPVTPVSVTVEATSLAQATARALAHVTVTTTTVSVTVAPATATVPRGTTKQFTATVSGTTDQRVHWRVAGVLD